MRHVSYNISFIGAGNVAWHLAPALENVGHSVKEVYSKSGESAKKLVANLYDARVNSSLNFESSHSRLFILAVPDDSISEIAQSIQLPEQSLLLHTSGSKGLEVLEYTTAAATGIFYPLQTFSKAKTVDLERVPFLLESEDREAAKIMKQLADTLSKNVHFIDGSQRKNLHLAAVFACNFTNHLLSISEELMHAAKLDFELLRPLIIETIDKALTYSPSQVQTGPAKRGDLEILDRQMAMLNHDEQAQEIYRLISQRIIDKS